MSTRDAAIYFRCAVFCQAVVTAADHVRRVRRLVCTVFTIFIDFGDDDDVSFSSTGFDERNVQQFVYNTDSIIRLND
jgi:hypothetical protein